jgi:uncharacterized spore protein YtfJ
MNPMSEVAPNVPTASSDGIPAEVGDLATRQAQHATRMAERIFAAAQPGVVFGQPVVSGSVTVITTSEVSSGGGFGSGSGFGRGEPRQGQAGQPSGEAATATPPSIGGGGGLGGGGGAMARPVAVIVIGPDGVRVQPIYDVTKVALAGLAAFGTIVAIWSRSRRRR